jgi:hypothetical protein
MCIPVKMVQSMIISHSTPYKSLTFEGWSEFKCPTMNILTSVTSTVNVLNNNITHDGRIKIDRKFKKELIKPTNTYTVNRMA